MVVGIDIRPLQTGHKYRGIGEACKQLTNHLINEFVNHSDVKVVFFEYDDDQNDPKDLLEIPESQKYSVVKLGVPPENELGDKKAKLKRAIKELYLDPIPEAKGCDVYLQFDQAMGIPKKVKKTILMSHDFIPNVFKRQYFISAWEPFRARAARSTLRTLYHNYKFNRIQQRSYKLASKIVAVSKSTKNDILKFTKAKSQNIVVIHHGVDVKPVKTTKDTSKVDLPTKPYLLFVGAGDQRRPVYDLIAAFNNLKAEGNDIQLALVGENFISQETIPTPFVRRAVLQSSYKEDILMMGYVDDFTKQKLYKNAIAYVYTTLYEGFGIPVLESMLFDCPVITYKNSSIPEVGDKYAIYAKDWWNIKVKVETLMSMNDKELKKALSLAHEHAQKFTWEASASKFISLIFN